MQESSRPATSPEPETGLESSAQAEALSKEGTTVFDTGKYRSAAKKYSQSRKLLCGGDTPGTVTCLNSQGRLDGGLVTVTTTILGDEYIFSPVFTAFEQEPGEK
ncbi:hypothetical protein B0H10DRAFT_1944836 [Mycena sp. CBHHK59/15]|nr:hypothetical protein B0H10DRAFT_1956458 [Mycena sp. CBHHK59/15]KAJ6622234.1 hypothetical protein B0H10DRAFT_1944836 [Mycena sp. CBHHK59/15]